MTWLLGLTLAAIGLYLEAGTGWALAALGSLILTRQLFDRWLYASVWANSFNGSTEESEPERGHGGRMGGRG